MKQPERERLQYIHDSLKEHGYLSVLSLRQKFKVSNPTATKAVKAYKELAPHNMEFNEKKKLYLRLDSFVDVVIPEASETKALASVHVLESDRALVSASDHKHWEVYAAGVLVLGIKGK